MTNNYHETLRAVIQSFDDRIAAEHAFHGTVAGFPRFTAFAFGAFLPIPLFLI